MVSCADIGQRIKMLREAKGLTQSELAQNLNINNLNIQRETVNRWENGSRDLKTEYTIALADYFEVSCDYILRGIKSENVVINRELGLSDKAIDALRTLKFKQDGIYTMPGLEYMDEQLQTINVLLENYKNSNYDLLTSLSELLVHHEKYGTKYIFNLIKEELVDNDLIESLEHIESHIVETKIDFNAVVISGKLATIQSKILALRNLIINQSEE